jgi:hypothetical protein
MRRLTNEQLLSELRRRPGLIPVDIDTRTRRLHWLDLETYHVYEGFFHRGIERFEQLKQLRGGLPSHLRFVTDLSVLGDGQILTDSIYPTGFIFHAGRCGSTLLARILARDRRHLVVGESAAHNQVLLCLTNNGSVKLTPTVENKTVYRNLVLAMSRRRLPSHHAHFIKFTSFNILFFEFIRSVFPDVPAIFLYRKPAEVLASYTARPPGWFDSNQQALRRLLAKATAEECAEEDIFASPANAVAAYFAAGLRAGESGTRCLNYDELTPGNLAAILKVLNLSPTVEQLTAMQSQFRFDSKADNRTAEFVRRRRLDVAPHVECSARDRLKHLYDQLAQSELNVIRAGSAPKAADNEA